MRYDVRHNVRVSPVGGRRPAAPGFAAPPAAQVRIDALSEVQRRIVTAMLREVGAEFRLHGATLYATLSGRCIATLASRWRSTADVRQLGVELAAAWEPLPGVIPIAGGALEYRRRALVMGIINTTPDSFYPPSRKCGVAAAVATALQMAEQGADLVDLGGESTRPGAAPVAAAEEIRRVVPAVAAVVAAGGPPVSIDTAKAEVAAAALDAGAAMVNDVSGLRDPRLRRLVAERRVPAVVMHLRGTPRTMQQAASYQDTLGEVLGELKRRLNEALAAGVRRRQLIVDPGIGFGKRVADNLRLLQGLPTLRALGPVLVGVSRKSFLGTVLGAPLDERLPGTTVANTIALLRGADILRVHDVAAAAQAVRLVAALEADRDLGAVPSGGAAG
jgi:dihydropteroate synthase